jgi:predicted RNA-binding protein associated with RNAse of E/G family
MKNITVIKLDHQGEETWRYQGKIIERQGHQLTLEAFFDRDDTPVDGMVLRRGDRFIETYFDNRWYNIFEVHDRDDDRLKGWYCNLGWPAEFGEDQISYRDLALDLLVLPDGSQKVLDEAEFKRLPIPPEVREKALRGLVELKERFKDLPNLKPASERG